jgi:stringent starvation protein B
MTEPTSTKPYLVRAIYEWCTDNGYTPYLAVAVNETTRVPRAHVRNGEIVLNVSALATHRLQMSNTEVSFTARFSGVAEEIWVPIDRVTAIYAKETGHGMAFEVAKDLAEPIGLRDVSVESPAASEDDDPKPPSGPVAGGSASTSGPSGPSGPSSGGSGRPALRRVK